MQIKRCAMRLASTGLAFAALFAYGEETAKPASPSPRAGQAEAPPVTGPAGSAAVPDAPLEALAWLAGCWTGKTGRNEFREHWMRPAGGLMLGMGRTTSRGKAIGYEAMRIEADPAGVPVFTAKPSDKPEASFKSIKFDATGIVFENPDHDFPQRIKYQLRPDGTLDARIEGNLKGREARIEYPMQRTSCE